MLVLSLLISNILYQIPFVYRHTEQIIAQIISVILYTHTTSIVTYHVHINIAIILHKKRFCFCEMTKYKSKCYSYVDYNYPKIR